MARAHSESSRPYSWMRKFGTQAPMLAQVAIETGLPALWGASSTWYASAMAAIFTVSRIPPQASGSGWMMSTARRSISSRHWLRPTIFSPAAMGTVVFAFSSTRESTLSQSVGSSRNRRRTAPGP